MKLVFSQYRSAVVLLLVTLPATAHHGAALFDLGREITLEGVVTRVEWGNPHVYIEVETRADPADTTVWMIEGSSASLARRVGWSPESLEAGDRVTVVANPGRNTERKLIRGVSFTKEDGTLLAVPNLRSVQVLTPEPPARLVASDLSGTWISDPSSPRSQYPDSWPLTAKGIATLESYDESLNPFNDCVPLAAPWLMVSTGFVKGIEIREEAVVIRAADAVRMIHMDVESHDGAQFTIQGHSLGRWEDEELVVDTTHFSDHLFGYGRGLASGTQKHLIERFALSSDGSRLNYSFQVDDPEYLTGRVVGTFDLVYRPDLPNPEESCDPDTARRFLGD